MSALFVAATLAAHSPAASATPAVRAGRPHVMRRYASSLTYTTSTARQLTDYGGPLISAPKVYAVLWGAGTFFPQLGDGEAASFFGGVLQSSYVDWLSEYDSASQTIGRGSFVGPPISITPSPTNNGSQIDDAANIAPELEAQIAARHLPTPDANTIFVLYFRQGQVITEGGMNSLTGFCAYHNSISAAPSNIRYAVMPYIDNLGCGTDSAWDNMTAVASHELIETMTDPDGGLASTYAPPLGWYNASYGEIGDLCNAQHARVVGGDGGTYVVQKQWSNTEHACIATHVRTISVGDQSVFEGNTGTRIMQFPITLSDPSPTAVSVTYRLVDGTATGGAAKAPGVDYNNLGGASTTVTFTPGTSGFTPVEKIVSVAVYGATSVVPSKTFTLNLSNPTGGYRLARAQAVGTIVNDASPAGAVLGISNGAVSAGDLTPRAMPVIVTLSQPTTTTVSATFATSGPGAGTAYKATQGTISFPAGSVERTIKILVYPDSAPPPGETVTVTLTNIVGVNATVQTAATVAVLGE